MKTFTCVCGNRLHFENTRCIVCNRQLGFITGALVLSALDPAGEDRWQALSVPGSGSNYKQCLNYKKHNVCNWMIPADDTNHFCGSCRLNKIIPNLGKAENHELWKRVETAKRRLLFTLYCLKLPVISRAEDPEKGLGFRFLEDQTPPTWQQKVKDKDKIYTGHLSGLITINIAEAVHSERESVREKMNESYRTLLGHFRHESGHYYWERLINNSRWHEEFRSLFGDENMNYSEAMSLHYKNNRSYDWQENHITHYAGSHPWEDWAETWAHFLHIYDTLQTANDLQLSAGPLAFDVLTDIENALQQWQELAIVLNALNRSMGMEDPYPFAINDVVANKLHFIYTVIANSAVEV
ncbi:MAG: putative zinc-binding peptidase [Gammaproteobacteria bacterium]|jgi:hypothetical protein